MHSRPTCREVGMKALLLDSDLFNYLIIFNSHRVSENIPIYVYIIEYC